MKHLISFLCVSRFTQRPENFSVHTFKALQAFLTKIYHIILQPRSIKFRWDWRSGRFSAPVTGYSAVSDDTHSLGESIPVWYPNLSMDFPIEPIWRIQRIRAFSENMDFLLRLLDFFNCSRVGQTKSDWFKGRTGESPKRERFRDIDSEGTDLESMSAQTLWSPEVCSITNWYSKQTATPSSQCVSCLFSEMGTLSHRIKDINQVAMILEPSEWLFCSQEVT